MVPMWGVFLAGEVSWGVWDGGCLLNKAFHGQKTIVGGRREGGNPRGFDEAGGQS